MKVISKLLISALFLMILVLPSFAPFSAGFSNVTSASNASAVVNYPYAISASFRTVKDLRCASTQRVFFSVTDNGQRNLSVDATIYNSTAGQIQYFTPKAFSVASGLTYRANECSLYAAHSTDKLTALVAGWGQFMGVQGSLSLWFPFLANGNTYSFSTYPKMAFTWKQHLKGGSPTVWSFTDGNIGTKPLSIWNTLYFGSLPNQDWQVNFGVNPKGSATYTVSGQFHVNIGTKLEIEFGADLYGSNYHVYLDYVAFTTARRT